MCMTSAIGDNFRSGLPTREYWKTVEPFLQPSRPLPEVSRAEFDALKRDMQELKQLLTAAKRFDDRTGQQDCEMEEKVAILKKLAGLVGVDLGDVFGKSA